MPTISNTDPCSCAGGMSSSWSGATYNVYATCTETTTETSTVDQNVNVRNIDVVDVNANKVSCTDLMVKGVSIGDSFQNISAIPGETTVTGDLNVAGNLDVVGTSNLYQPTMLEPTVNGTLFVDGEINTTSNLTVAGLTGLTGQLFVDSYSTLSGGCLIENGVTVSGSAAINGGMTVSGGITQSSGTNTFLTSTIGSVTYPLKNNASSVTYTASSAYMTILDSIPSYAKRITISFYDMSGTSTGNPCLQYKESTSWKTTGYTTITWGSANTNGSRAQSTGIGLYNGTNLTATSTLSGVIVLVANSDSTKWNITYQGVVASAPMFFSAMISVTSLTGLRFYIDAGSFDAGTATILIE